MACYICGGVWRPSYPAVIIIVAAAPGEVLPLWPALTNAAEPAIGQRPFVAEDDAIAGL